MGLTFRLVNHAVVICIDVLEFGFVTLHELAMGKLAVPSAMDSGVNCVLFDIVFLSGKSLSCLTTLCSRHVDSPAINRQRCFMQCLRQGRMREDCTRDVLAAGIKFQRYYRLCNQF